MIDKNFDTANGGFMVMEQHFITTYQNFDFIEKYFSSVDKHLTILIKNLDTVELYFPFQYAEHSAFYSFSLRYRLILLISSNNSIT